jgi:hypothetical protein
MEEHTPKTNPLNLNLDIDTRWQIQAHQHIDGLGIRIQNINQTIMRSNLKMFVRVFVNERGAANRKAFNFGRQRHWANNSGSGALSRVDNAFGRLIQNAMIVSFQADAYLLLCHSLPIIQRSS